MRAEYLVRFDDLCPTTNWLAWDQIERLLLENDVRPLIAVIPDNRDEKLLKIGEPLADFWDRVRAWQERGWTIGMHGYQHVPVTRERGMFGYSDWSEFAGLSREEQASKIQSAMAVFEREAVQPNVWIAPNHSFDETTLLALRDAGLRVISDGLSLYPYTDKNGMFWIPRQLSRFEKRPLGIWTVCLHHTRWTNAEVERFESLLIRFQGQLTNVDTILLSYPHRRWSIADSWFLGERRLKHRIARHLASRPGKPRC